MIILKELGVGLNGMDRVNLNSNMIILKGNKEHAEFYNSKVI